MVGEKFVTGDRSLTDRYLLNNEQVIQKLADSYPIKRAAQFTAYLAHKGKQIETIAASDLKASRSRHSYTETPIPFESEEGFDNLVKSEPVKKIQDEASSTTRKINLFKDTFVKEVKEGMKEIKGKDKDR